MDSLWTRWLQKHRVELNALTTRRLIDWLDAAAPVYRPLCLEPSCDPKTTDPNIGQGRRPAGYRPKRNSA